MEGVASCKRNCDCDCNSNCHRECNCKCNGNEKSREAVELQRGSINTCCCCSSCCWPFKSLDLLSELRLLSHVTM